MNDKRSRTRSTASDRKSSRTDWDYLDRVSDTEIEAAMAKDPDWAGLRDVDWSDAVLVVPPRKKAISIRVDQDVLDFFKQHGTGYQRRINAVLRSYMQQKKAPAKNKKRA